jgi:hypothetical protein
MDNQYDFKLKDLNVLYINLDRHYAPFVSVFKYTITLDRLLVQLL